MASTSFKTPSSTTKETAQSGAWTEQVLVEGCGTHRQLNVLLTVNHPGQISATPLLPRTTRADPVLEKDGIPFAFNAAAIGFTACKPTYVYETEFLGVSDETPVVPGKPGWTERWTIAHCAERIPVTIRLRRTRPARRSPRNVTSRRPRSSLAAMWDVCIETGRVVRPILALAMAALGLAIVSRPASGAEMQTFVAKDWGLTVAYPAGLTLSRTFKQNYFDRGDWRFSYAAGAGTGTPIVAFALPDLKATDEGGGSAATAELTIGASRDPDVVASCLTYGMNSGNNVETTTRAIGGVTFTEVPDNGDTSMQQTVETDDFRAVTGDTCLAIDVVRYVGGTSNRRPEYSADQIAVLRSVLGGIRFE